MLSDPPSFGSNTSPLQIDLSATPESVRAARHATQRYAQRHGIDTERVGLAVSEAMTNALVHNPSTEPTEGSLRVTASLSGDALSVSVSDQGSGVRAHPRGDRLGLGLPLIASVADSMYVESSPGSGTRVVMRFR
jgi:anti-sigma regulatory factor (Ser/Thr protein kinase)